MNWSIPEPYAIPAVKPLRWQNGWRVFFLCCIAILLCGVGSYFWLKDSRLLLYTFGMVVAIMVLAGILAGWKLYRYGVEAEHAQGIARYNQLNEHQWQRWAQAGVPVLGMTIIFPEAVPHPSDGIVPVTVDIPLFLPKYPGETVVINELLLPLVPLLTIFTQKHPLIVLLPDTLSQETFRVVWQRLSLPVSALSGFELLQQGCFSLVNTWVDEKDTRSGRLVLFVDWTDNRKATQGAVAWLLGCGSKNELPVRCTLHRPMQTKTDQFAADIEKFFHYQPLAQAMTDFWFDQSSKPCTDILMIQRSRYLKKTQDNGKLAPSLHSQYLPHWLGRTTPSQDIFAITLMMQMAEHRQGTQVLLWNRNNTLTLQSVSAGDRTDD
ncbi:hypothetical protein [Cronobacter sakazakii]|uniref:hypothetical protein n=1 Tax=Cronobacter sakazakii TaxID=28141 RepID=UPI002894233A|nr:hypothetical protein [Cronobacter sakazakii]MDT3570298.1 hypothetical protein [Cronobacter sakazakii]